MAEEGAEYRVLGLNQLRGHVLVQDVAEALGEVVHRSDPVALEGAPDLAYVAILVSRIGYFFQELAGARAHLAPESEAKGQELASLGFAKVPVFGNLPCVLVPKSVGRSETCTPAPLLSVEVVYVDVEVERVDESGIA